MSSTVQRICGCAGIVWVAVFTLGFWVIAGFIPPPSPNASAQVIAAFYDTNRTSIRVGLILSAIVSGLFTVFSAGISMQLRRIEGRYSGLAYMQLALGTLVVLELLFPMMFWLVATFRAERSPESVQLINDLGWMPLWGSPPPFCCRLSPLRPESCWTAAPILCSRVGWATSTSGRGCSSPQGR